MNLTKKENKKLYILDTNVLISSPHSIFAFDDNDVAITDITIEELDGFKNASGEKGINSRECLRIISTLNKKGHCFSSSIQTNAQHFISLNDVGGKFTIFSYDFGLGLIQKNNDKIIAICQSINKLLDFMEYSSIILVTNDLGMQINCGKYNIQTQSYLSDDALLLQNKSLYSGRTTVFASPECINALYKNGEIDLNEFDLFDEEGKTETIEFVQNEFVIIKNINNQIRSAFGVIKGDKIKILSFEKLEPFGIKPQNVNQRFALEALLSPTDKVPLVLLLGPAGTAKTFLSLVAGLYGQQNGGYQRVLIARPNVKFDEDIGYLKGTEEDKIAPLMRPIMDNLEVIEMYTKINTKQLLSDGVIRAEALAYMRGRSITNTYIIIDEAQNLTPTQAFGIISRAGIGSKVVLAGDPQQIDDPRLTSTRNGLCYTANKMMGSKLCAQLSFDKTDCVRSDLAKEAIKLLAPKGSDFII